MQIVIDIPKTQYEYLAKIAIAGKEPLGYFERVIMRGTPLPDHHGDLIDRTELLAQPLDIANYPSNFVRVAPTIIEADKAESEG